MKIVCSPSEKYLKTRKDADLCVLLFEKAKSKKLATCGESIEKYFRKNKLGLKPPAWDLLSFALSVIACDFGAAGGLHFFCKLGFLPPYGISYGAVVFDNNGNG